MLLQQLTPEIFFLLEGNVTICCLRLPQCYNNFTTLLSSSCCQCHNLHLDSSDFAAMHIVSYLHLVSIDVSITCYAKY
uniref:Uncharacterized protein n=1 Tax=Rhizophora mucronata TaxID=61149 RepID=A0A2P2NY12_RHIMU